MEGQSSPEPGEECLEHQLCESCRQKELEEKIHQIMAEKQVELDRLNADIAVKKEKLKELMKCQQSLAMVWGEVLMARLRVKLMKQAYEMEKASQQHELEELKVLKKSNSRRDDRLARVRTKNLRSKEATAEREYADTRNLAVSQMVELQVLRRRLVTDVFRGVFPIEVEPLSEADAGDDDYEASVTIDSVLEVDDGWMLSGVHQHTLPNIRIVTASMPAAGNYSSFLKAVSEKRKVRQETMQQGAVPTVTPDDDKPVHPLKNSYQSTPAGLVFTALLTEILATTLDQPLPYPLSRRTAIGEYGTPSRRKRDFLNSVAKLDDNILFLCFAQNVPLSALTPGHTLQNLLALVTHTQLGRSGAFECSPEMMRYRGRHGSPVLPTLSHDLEDSEPPAVVYTSDQSKQPDNELAESSSDPEDNFYSKDREEFDEMYDWEYLEPNIKELRLFEEEQIRAQLTERTQATGSQKMAGEMDARRDGLRRLDYDSTYLDYSTAMASTRSSTVSTESAKTSDISESSGGFFGTLSSMWSSAWGSRPSSS